MIEARSLTRRFGDRTVVDDVSFRLEPGQLCALLGPNGAGKTTTVRMLLGLVLPSGGSAVVGGIELPGAAESLARLRANAGLLTESPGFYDRLSAVENLMLFGRLYRIDPASLRRRIDEQLARFGLADRSRDPVATFSKGMKQRLAIVRTIFHEPAVVFFDEPTAGLDPESARDVRDLIASLKQAGRTIVVCTHNLAEATELADVVGVLQRRLLAFGPPSTLGGAVETVGFRLLVTDRAEEAAAAIGAMPGVEAVVRSATELELTLAADDRAAPEIVRRVVAAGIGIRELRRLERSLESIYLETIRRAS